MPASHARSSRSAACCSVSPIPKNAGAEPTPPKLPQPSASRDTLTPVDPTRWYLISRRIVAERDPPRLLVVGHHRPDLDRAVARARDPRRDLGRLVEVLGLD